jgi:hypothetical protein
MIVVHQDANIDGLLSVFNEALEDDFSVGSVLYGMDATLRVTEASQLVELMQYDGGRDGTLFALTALRVHACTHSSAEHLSLRGACCLLFRNDVDGTVSRCTLFDPNGGVLGTFVAYEGS